MGIIDLLKHKQFITKNFTPTTKKKYRINMEQQNNSNEMRLCNNCKAFYGT